MLRRFLLPQILIKIYLIDAFLYEMKESGRKKCRSAPRTDIKRLKLTVKKCQLRNTASLIAAMIFINRIPLDTRIYRHAYSRYTLKENEKLDW